MTETHIPATADLLDGWSGPCEVLAHARFPVPLPDAAHLAMMRGESAWVACFLSPDACGGDTLPKRNVCLDRGQNFSFDPARCRMRLDPRRPEVAHRIADVSRLMGHEIGHWLPPALGGKAPSIGDLSAAEASGRLLARSWAGILAGVGPVRGLLPEWRHYGDTSYRGATAGSAEVRVFDVIGYRRYGWVIRVDGVELGSGPETGAEGRAAADRAALAAGFALVTDGALVLPALTPASSGASTSAEGRQSSDQEQP